MTGWVEESEEETEDEAPFFCFFPLSLSRYEEALFCGETKRDGRLFIYNNVDAMPALRM